MVNVALQYYRNIAQSELLEFCGPAFNGTFYGGHAPPPVKSRGEKSQYSPFR